MIIILVVFASTIIASVYGALHNQITYSISEEYFTKFKYGQFGFEPEWFGGNIQTVALIGVFSSWWTGLIIGIILGLVGLIYNSKDMIKMITKSIVLTLITTVSFGLIGFIYGYTNKNNDIGFCFPENLQNETEFLIAGSIHNFSYIGGLVGLIVGAIYLIKKRNTAGNN